MLTELGRWLRGNTESQDQQQGNQVTDTDTPDIDREVADAQPNVPSDAERLYAFDRSLVPEGARAVVPTDLYDTARILDNVSPWQMGATDTASGDPLVLIVHSHGGEGYTAKGTLYLEADALIGRSDDAANSVVGVGKALCDTLNENGVTAIHLTTRFDSDGNAGAFTRAAQAVVDCLKQYPTVRYVIDVHRGAGISDNGDLLRAVAWQDGETVAQSLWITPTDGSSAAPAMALYKQMNEQGHHLCYGVEKQEFGEDWDIKDAYVLRIEVGTAGNSVGEAASAAEEIARAMCAVLK